MRELEAKVLADAKTLLQTHAQQLASRGITYRDPQIEVWTADPSKYTSEIRVIFLKSGQIDDVLEFHIFRDGRALVTEQESSDWFRKHIATLGSPA